MWNTKLAYAAGVVVVAIAFTVITFEVDAWTGPGQPGPGLFPRALGISLIVISTVNLVLDVVTERQRRNRAAAQPVSATVRQDGISQPGRDDRLPEPDASQEQEQQPAEGEPPPVHPWTVTCQIGLAVAFILLFEPLGAMVSVVLFGTATVFLLIRRDRAKTAVMVVATSVALVLLTQIVLQQNLPAGILGGSFLPG